MLARATNALRSRGRDATRASPTIASALYGVSGRCAPPCQPPPCRLAADPRSTDQVEQRSALLPGQASVETDQTVFVVGEIAPESGLDLGEERRLQLPFRLVFRDSPQGLFEAHDDLRIDAATVERRCLRNPVAELIGKAKNKLVRLTRHCSNPWPQIPWTTRKSMGFRTRFGQRESAFSAISHTTQRQSRTGTSAGLGTTG